MEAAAQQPAAAAVPANAMAFVVSPFMSMSCLLVLRATSRAHTAAISRGAIDRAASRLCSPWPAGEERAPVLRLGWTMDLHGLLVRRSDMSGADWGGGSSSVSKKPVARTEFRLAHVCLALDPEVDHTAEVTRMLVLQRITLLAILPGGVPVRTEAATDDEHELVELRSDFAERKELRSLPMDSSAAIAACHGPLAVLFSQVRCLCRSDCILEVLLFLVLLLRRSTPYWQRRVSAMAGGAAATMSHSLTSSHQETTTESEMASSSSPSLCQILSCDPKVVDTIAPLTTAGELALDKALTLFAQATKIQCRFVVFGPFSLDLKYGCDIGSNMVNIEPPFSLPAGPCDTDQRYAHGLLSVTPGSSTLMEPRCTTTLHKLLIGAGGLQFSVARRFFQHLVAAIAHLHGVCRVVHGRLYDLQHLGIDRTGRLIVRGLRGSIDITPSTTPTISGGGSALIDLLAAPRRTIPWPYHRNDAPEITERRGALPLTQLRALDTWGMGLVLLALLEQRMSLFWVDPEIRIGLLPPGPWIELLRGMLEEDPTQRWTMRRIANHEWIRRGLDMLPSDVQSILVGI